MKNLSITICIALVVLLSEASYAASLQSLSNIENVEQPKTRPALIKRPHFNYEAQGDRDPFQSYIEKVTDVFTPVTSPVASAAPEVLPKFEIQGIIIGGIIPQAIINGKVLRTGDTIDEARILEISKSGVIMVYKKTRFNVISPAYHIYKSSKLETKGGSNENK